MTNGTAMFMVITGLILTMFGVGGIEASLDNVGLLQGLFVSVVGLMTMGVGVLALNINTQTDYYK
jgi:hypothetical protein